jgi:uncharacterized protein (DUF488 family)
MTIGHSTLDLSAFLKALGENGVQRLVDVRSFPGSRRYPWFGRDALEQSLPATGIAYQWMPGLGGRRKPTGSENGAWRNESFRGYADYMQTPEFAAGLAELIDISQGEQVAYMCSEAVPWRCHRSLISDALTARGFRVENIFVKPNGESERKPHSMTPFALVMGDVANPRVTYPLDPGHPQQGEIPFGAKAS